MIFERTQICSLYSPYSIYFRMAVYVCMHVCESALLVVHDFEHGLIAQLSSL